MTPHVLTPDLYNALVRVFGTVKIASQGEAAQLFKEPRRQNRVRFFQSHQQRGNPDEVEFRTRVKYGEYFRTCCPFCNDTRYRLYISHLWGEYPDAAFCFNEECLRNPANREHLRLLVFRTSRLVHFKTYEGRQSALTLSAVPPPGELLPLTELPPDNQLRCYLEQREFDLDYLSDVYGMACCLSVENREHWPMVGRLYVPIMMRGDLVGWQGRYPDDLDWKSSGIPKYYNLPAMPKRLMLYGFDQAEPHEDVAIVEGVTDVVRAGPAALGLLGKTMSPAQRAALLPRRHRGFVAIALDPGAAEEAEQIRASLESLFGEKIFVVQLPAGMDPGKMRREVFWELINRTARSKGLTPVTEAP